MGPIGCPDASVRDYYYTLCNNQEEHISHLCCGRSLKSRMFHFVQVFQMVSSLRFSHQNAVCLYLLSFAQFDTNLMFDKD